VNAKEKATTANVNLLKSIVSPYLGGIAPRLLLFRRENGGQLLQAYGDKVTIA
jgi:hypothetical protein